MAEAAAARIDGARWMTDCPHVRGKTLKEIVMPGSHDAGMYLATGCTTGAGPSNTRTQTRTIAEQLSIGVRQFDLRPILRDGELVCGHFSKLLLLGWTGCYGAPLKRVLEDVRAFVAEPGRRELVLLNFSHTANAGAKFRGFTSTEWETLFALVATTLDGHLHAEPERARLTKPIDHYVAQGSRVIACFDGPAVNRDWAAKGMHTYGTIGKTWKRLPAAGLVMFDDYTNSPTPETVAKDQLAKLIARRNHRADQFLLAWTCTQDKLRGVGTGAGETVRRWPVLRGITRGTDRVAILRLAAGINRQLRPALASIRVSRGTMPNVISVDDASPEVLDTCLWLMERLAKP